MLATAAAHPPSYSAQGSQGARSSRPRCKGDESGSGGDSSDDNYSVDEPVLSVLRDDLRSKTELFFESLHPVSRARRRASSTAPSGDSTSTPAARAIAVRSVGGTGMARIGLRQQQSWNGIRQQQSWNGLNDLEKGVGGMMRRQTSGTSSPLVSYLSTESRSSNGVLKKNAPVLNGKVSPSTEEGCKRELPGGFAVGGNGSGTSGSGTSSGSSRRSSDSSTCGRSNISGGGGVDGGGSPVEAHAIIGESVEDEFCVAVVRNDSSDTNDVDGGCSQAFVDQGESLAFAKTQRHLYIHGGDGARPDTLTASLSTTQHLIAETSPGLARRKASADSDVVLKDLRVRSAEATRTLEALKVMLKEEQGGRESGAHAAEGKGEGENRSGRASTKLWPTSGDVVASDVPAVIMANRAANVSAKGDDTGDVQNRMVLLLEAMDNLQHINAELSAALNHSVSSSQTHRGRHRRGNSTSSLAPPPRQTLGLRQRSHRFSSSALLPRHPRSSSDLLQRRRSEQGQAEPMSCGVPRHRVQVTKGGGEVVYFELAITQARSTWTVERRVDEFVQLRRVLVATAAGLAAGGSSVSSTARWHRGHSVGTTAVSREPRLVRRWSSSGGKDGKRNVKDVQGVKDEHRRRAEARVPPLDVEESSWLEKSRFGSMLFGARKREEKLAEKQVLLASWLANVLADRELMSADLVRFLGGDSGVQTQPIVADAGGDGDGDGDRDAGGDDNRDTNASHGQNPFSDTDSADSTDTLESEYPSDYHESVDGDNDDDDNDDDTEDDDDDEDGEDNLGSELDSLRGSLCAPEEWGEGLMGQSTEISPDRRSGGKSNAHDRLEKVMGQRERAVSRSRGSVSRSRSRSRSPKSSRSFFLNGRGDTGQVEGQHAFRATETRRFQRRDKGHMAKDRDVAVSDQFPSIRGSGSRRFGIEEEPRRGRTPSSSSPTPPGVTLDAFFQAPM